MFFFSYYLTIKILHILPFLRGKNTYFIIHSNRVHVQQITVGKYEAGCILIASLFHFFHSFTENVCNLLTIGGELYIDYGNYILSYSSKGRRKKVLKKILVADMSVNRGGGQPPVRNLNRCV